MKQLRYRTRLIVILSLFAIIPAVLLTFIWGGTVSSAISLVSGGAAWEHVATTGQQAIEAARSARLTPRQRQLLNTHEHELRTSLEQARRYNFLAGKFSRIVIIAGLFSLLIFGFAAGRVAGHLSRQMSRPLDELVGWTERIGRGEPLPPPGEEGARGAPEFAILRDRMREMAQAVEEGRRRDG